MMPAMKQHPCTLVPRALWPRWDRKERLASTLDFCQAIGADEIMLFPTGQLVSPGHLEGKMHVQRMQALKRAMVEAKRRGIAVMVNDWAMLDDFGHAQGTHQEKMWPWAVDITLTPAIGYCCMLSPKVQQKAIDALLSLAKVGVRKVFLDDEIRHDWHPAANRKEGAHYCFCDLHMREFARWQGSKSGKGIAAAEMAKRLQSDKPEDAALRRQWIAFKRDMLLNFIHKVRSVVHAKVPDFRIGQMATFIHFQTLGGVGFGEQIKGWAGELRPLCRPPQGWYGDHIRPGLVLGVAQTLFTISQLPPETELYSEVDSGGPWTQLDSSARMSGDFQIKVNLILNIKKHSLLYLGEGPDDPFLRNRYIRQISKSRSVFDALAAQIPANARRSGIQFLMSPNLGAAHPLQCRGPAGDSADPQGITGAGLGQPAWPKAFSNLARSGIPMVFEDSDIAILTGGMADAMDAQLPAIMASKSLIIDGPAAADLEKRGLLKQFGLKISRYGNLMNERLEKHPFNGDASGEVLAEALPISPRKMFPYQSLKTKGMRGVDQIVLSRMIDSDHRDRGIGLVMVEKPDGRRACVLPYDLGDQGAWGYTVRKGQWERMLTFLAGRPPEVWIENAMDIWPVSYSVPGDVRCWVGLINFGHDVADDCMLWVTGKGPVKFVDDKGKLRPVPPACVVRKGARTGIRLTRDHRLNGLDVRLFVVA